MHKFLVLVSIGLLCVHAALAGEEYDLKPSQKIVAIGDIHGDYDAMMSILTALNLIDAYGYWKGGDTHLVLLGDLVDRGIYGRHIMDFVMDLEKEAKAAGGQVHTLLGNHELLVTMGYTHYVKKKELQSYSDFLKPGDRNLKTAFRSAFQGDSKYAKWFRQRPAMVRINDNLFVHGGLTMKMLGLNINQINKVTKNWFKYYQDISEAPIKSNRWVIDDEGPLWTRALNPHSGEMDQEGLDELLAHFNSKRVLVGHTVVDSLKDSFSHPDFNSQVYMIDTGISYVYEGKLSALVIQKGNIISYRVNRKSGKLKFIRKRAIQPSSCQKLLTAS